MPYTIFDEKGKFAESSSFMFYMPFIINGMGSINIEDIKTGCFLAVLSDGLPRNQIPNIPNWRDGETASEKVTIASDEESVGTLVFNHMALENQVEIERENEWSELRIYGGRKPIDKDTPAEWLVTNDWRMEPRGQNEEADNFSKYFDFGSIKDALCDETVVVRGRGGSLQRITLCRRMIKDTIAEIIMQNSSLLRVTEGMPVLTLRTLGNSKHVTNVADREFFKQMRNPNTEHSGYVLIAAGAFAFQSADTMLEEWRMPLGGLDFNSVRQKLGAIAFAPNNAPADANRLFRQLHNIDNTDRDGVTTGRMMSDAPVEVLFVERVK